jgi:hypothetical protein
MTRRIKVIELARTGQGRFRASVQERRDGAWVTIWRCVHMTKGYSGHQTRETAVRCAERTVSQEGVR